MKRSVSRRFVICNLTVVAALLTTAVIQKGTAQVAYAAFCSAVVSPATCGGRLNPPIRLTSRDYGAVRATSFSAAGGDRTASFLTLMSPGTSTVSPGRASRELGLVSSSTTLAPNPTTAYTTAPNGSVVLTATVTTGATGTVTFTEGVNTLTCAEGAQPLPLDGSSQAVCTTTMSAEGYHSLTATYSGDGTFLSSSGNAGVFTQNHSSNAGTVYCNTGAIVADGQSSSGFTHVNPYPSVIFIGDGVNTDLTSNVATLSVQLKNFSASSGINGTQMLLVAPDGIHAFDFWSHVGSGLVTGNYTLTDVAGSQLPNSGFISPGTYKPTVYSGTDVFTPAPPNPAPQLPGSFSLAPPFGTASFQSVFNGVAAHGAWKLYVYNNSGPGSTIDLSGGWCLNISAPTAAWVAHVRWTRTGRYLRFRWHASVTSGIAGFGIFARRPGGAPTELNHRLIPIHQSRWYSHKVLFAGRGPFTIRAMSAKGGWL